MYAGICKDCYGLEERETYVSRGVSKGNALFGRCNPVQSVA